MARPRKPTNILNAAGAFRKDPQRKEARAAEPAPVGVLGEPPAWMSEAQKAIWVELAAQLHQNVACSADRAAFASLVRLAEAARQPRFELSATVAFLKALGAFGMTPADRSRVQVSGKPVQENPWQKFGNTQK